MTAVTRATDELLLGEWACLGLLCAAPAHGFALSVRLRPDGDVGRVWSQSRPLVYRAIEQLTERRLVRAVGQEPGIAGGNRTILTATAAGRRRLTEWLATPVPHLRDLRSELLLKLLLTDICGGDRAPLVAAQREMTAVAAAALEDEVARDPHDVVTRWRFEASRAALHFLDTIGTG